MDRNSKRFRTSAALLMGSAVMAGLAGCSSDPRPVRPLTAEQFAARNGVTVDSRSTGNPVDRAGAVPYDSANVRPTREPEPTPAPGPDSSRISPAVSDAIRGSALPDTQPVIFALTPTTAPTTRAQLTPPVNEAGPVAVPVGFVVVEVNGKAIWSDKVLQALERPFAAEAKRNGEKQFRLLAQSLLMQQVEVLKRDELEVASAEQSLDAADRSLAQSLTTQWRAKQITAAGGSLEMARKRARADGWEFEELVNQQYRQYLVQLFYQKRVYPNIQVAASDVRAYYERNREKEFSSPGRIKFRVIKIDPSDRKYVSRDEAVADAEKILARTKSEDFAKLADEVNGDSKGGLVGTEKSDYWMQAGAYPREEVEKAVLAIRPGTVTKVVQDKGQLFIAKLEAVQEAKAERFDDQTVQDKITQKLRGQQIQAMREKHLRDLEGKAVTQRKAGKMEELLELAMKRYSEWSGKPAGG